MLGSLKTILNIDICKNNNDEEKKNYRRIKVKRKQKTKLPRGYIGFI